ASLLPHARLSSRLWRLGTFFFSSRRRHTRCYRDWSSDVCSSDLLQNEDRYASDFVQHGHTGLHFEGGNEVDLRAKIEEMSKDDRSEERRVGKECRTGWEA